MNKFKHIAFNSIVLLALIFSFSCIREDNNPDACISEMRIELRWMGTMPVDDDETVNISINPGTASGETDIESDVYGTQVDLQPGTTRIFAWEDYNNAVLDTVAWTIASTSLSRAPYSEPNIFSVGRATEEVPQEKTSRIIPLPMYRQVRPLVIVISILGDGSPLISGISGSVGNVAMKRSLDAGFPPLNGLDRQAVIESGSVDYDFTLVENETEILSFSGRRNLLGIDGNANQTLDIEVAFKDSQSREFPLDITEKMAGFHTQDINEPWYVMLTLRLGTNWDISIEDWASGPESWLVAN